MASNINAAHPVAGSPTTQSVRDNFSAAKTEIEALQTAVDNITVTMVRYLSQPGTLTLFTGKVRWYPPQAVNVLWLEASVDTPSTGSGITAELKKNGSVVNSVTIAAGQNKSSRVTLTGVTGTADDYFTVDVTAIGSGTPGSDLIIAVAYEYQ